MSKEIITIVFLTVCILVLDICIYKLTNDIKKLSAEKKNLETEIAINRQYYNRTELFEVNEFHIKKLHAAVHSSYHTDIKYLRQKTRDELFKQIEPYVEYKEIDISTLDKSGFAGKCIASISIQVKE